MDNRSVQNIRKNLKINEVSIPPPSSLRKETVKYKNSAGMKIGTIYKTLRDIMSYAGAAVLKRNIAKDHQATLNAKNIKAVFNLLF